MWMSEISRVVRSSAAVIQLICSDVVKDKIARPRPRPRPRPSRPRPRPRTRTLKAKAKATALKAKAKDTALEAKAKAKDTAFEAEAEAWTFDVKDEPKFQSQILQFSIGALWYLNCISLGQCGLNIE